MRIHLQAMHFSEVVGQNRIKKRLIQAANSGRVSHAQMLISQEGVGGLPLALAYATYLSCTNRMETDSCGKCPSCKKYAKLEHPDLHLFFPNNTTKEVSKNPSSSQFVGTWRKTVLTNPYINLPDWLHAMGIGNKLGIISERDSAEIVATTTLKNYESQYRIIIIWMAEKMNESCSNKILKLIEEPPPNTVFLLIVEDTEFILPTIISRVQAVNLELLTHNEVCECLVNKHALDSTSANNIASRSESNFRLAMLMAHSGDTEDLSAFFIRWMRICFAGKPPEVFGLADEFHGIGRESQKEWLKSASTMLRNATLHNWKPTLYLPSDQLQFVNKFSEYLDPEVASSILAMIDEASNQISRNAYAKLVLSDTSFRIGNLLRQKALA